MKVAFVHSYYSSAQPSGENSAVDAQAQALRRAGVEVLIVSRSTDERSAERGYAAKTAVSVATGLGPSPEAELDEFKPDLVHIHNLFPNWGTRWLRRWHGPVVATLHNYRPLCAAGTLYRDGHECTQCPDSMPVHAVRHRCYRNSVAATVPLAIRNWPGLGSDPLLSRANQLILLSERSQRTYTKFGLPIEKTAVVPNFAMQIDIGEQERRPEWIYAGRLSPEKGILRLLQHWPVGRQLKIYGDGPLRQVVQDHSNGNVQYMGSVDHEEIRRRLASARGLVFPSLWAEGLPLIFTEALSVGTPVVALKGNSPADEVARAGCGVVFDQWDALGAALNSFDRKREKLSRRAAACFEEKYTEASWVGQILPIYEAVRMKAQHA